MAQSLRLSIRLAQPQDAIGIARVYIESWRETYAGLLPDAALVAMSEARQTQNWAGAIRRQSARDHILVASDSKDRLYGLANGGPSRDPSLPFEAEVYALYVAPGYTGQGIGRALLGASFELFKRASFRGAIIWALAGNPSRFFYEAQGGSLVAERMTRVHGQNMREVGYGWPSLTPVAGNPT